MLGQPQHCVNNLTQELLCVQVWIAPRVRPILDKKTLTIDNGSINLTLGFTQGGNTMIRAYQVVICLLLCSSCYARELENIQGADENYCLETPEIGCEKNIELNWQSPGSYQLPNSRSTISVPDGHLIVVGEDARKYQVLSGNTYDKSLEAVVLSVDSFDTIYFKNNNEGYVSIEDWKDVDPIALLASISDATEEANKQRRMEGIPEIHVVGWLQEPTLDRQTNTVFWAIEAEDEREADGLVNSIAIRLGRNGFERLVWVTNKSTYVHIGGELDVMLQAHSFDPGYRYTDFTKGDNVAAYGIAGLVAATTGAKFGKAAIIGGAAILKKFGGVILAGILAAFYKLKGFFRRS